MGEIFPPLASLSPEIKRGSFSVAAGAYGNRAHQKCRSDVAVDAMCRRKPPGASLGRFPGLHHWPTPSLSGLTGKLNSSSRLRPNAGV